MLYGKRTAVIAVVSFLLLASGVTLLNSANTNASEPVDPVIEHLSKEKDISIEEATARVGWSEDALKLNQAILQQDVTGYGGLWISEDTDRVSIGITKSSTKLLIEKIVADYNLDGRVDYVTVENNLRSLEAARNSILSKLQKSDIKFSSTIGVGIDPSNNKVLLRTPTDQGTLGVAGQNLVQDIKADFEGLVKEVATKTNFRTFACNWWFCDSPLRGAVEIQGQSYSCTAGFGVMGNSGTKYILTAGHCGLAGNTYWKTKSSSYGVKNVGSVHRNVLEESTNIDAMIVKTDDLGSWDAVGKVYVRSGVGLGGYGGPSTNEAYDVTDHASNGDIIGERVCISGAKSADLNNYEGGSCGPIKEIASAQYSPDLGMWIDGLVRAQLCARPGDSGAPVFRLGKAQGILSGADVEGCSQTVYFTGMNSAISAFNSTIHIY